MPAPGGRNTISEAFANAYGVKGPVKTSYVGKDKFGNSIYKFTWTTQGGGGKGGRLGTITNTRTVAAFQRGGGAWTFARPGSATANPNRITAPNAVGAGSATFGGKTHDEWVDMAVAKTGDLVSRGIISQDDAKNLINGFNGWTSHTLSMWVSRAGTGNRPNSVIEMTPGEGAGLLGDVFTDI
jgi:hypothetical protein